MRKQSVVIKSNKEGLILVLDEQMPWDELKQEVAAKFQASAKFFGEAQMALCFQGRKLSDAEKLELTEVIAENCRIQIVCIADDNTETEAAMAKARKGGGGEAPDLTNLQDGRFYKGTLRSGQVLESETSIIILGDVNPGARVISKGNVIVLGSLKGNVYVGAAGNGNAFVAALSMDPVQLRIGDVIGRSADGTSARKKKKAESTPKIAFVEDGNIYIEPITKEVLNDIRL